LKVSQIKNIIGGIFAGSILASLPLSAQNSGDFLEVKVSLSAINILSSVPAISVYCAVKSSIVAGNGEIGKGLTALYFEGDPDDLTTFDPNEGDLRFAQVVAADRDAIPSEITVKILPSGDIPLDAWTTGSCVFGLFDPGLLTPGNYSVRFFWEEDAYEIPRNCEDVGQSLLYSCAAPDTFHNAFSDFVRPGYESE